MATLVSERMLFLHLPKTGGTWASAAMLAAGVAAARPEPLLFHATLAEAERYADRFTFAFVRHPLELWRSYWAFRMRDGWDATSAIDTVAASPDFDAFARGVIEHAPGMATSVYEQFVGPPDREIDFVGRFEHLVDDLVAALRQAGENFDESALRAQRPLNVSDYRSLPARYGRETAERLAECERGAIERFYPGVPVPEWLLEPRDRHRRGTLAARRQPARERRAVNPGDRP